MSTSLIHLKDLIPMIYYLIIMSLSKCSHYYEIVCHFTISHDYDIESHKNEIHSHYYYILCAPEMGFHNTQPGYSVKLGLMYE